MKFSEWIETDKGRMITFHDTRNMLETVWNASAEAAEARTAQIISDSEKEIGHLKFSLAGARDRAEEAERERNELRAKFEQAQRNLEKYGADLCAILGGIKQ